MGSHSWVGFAPLTWPWKDAERDSKTRSRCWSRSQPHGAGPKQIHHPWGGRAAQAAPEAGAPTCPKMQKTDPASPVLGGCWDWEHVHTHLAAPLRVFCAVLLPVAGVTLPYQYLWLLQDHWDGEWESEGRLRASAPFPMTLHSSCVQGHRWNPPGLKNVMCPPCPIPHALPPCCPKIPFPCSCFTACLPAPLCVASQQQDLQDCHQLRPWSHITADRSLPMLPGTAGWLLTKPVVAFHSPNGLQRCFCAV